MKGSGEDGHDTPREREHVEALIQALSRERAQRQESERALNQRIAVLSQELDRAIHRGGERAEKIFQNAADAILLVDRLGTYVYATASIERVTGYTVAETVGTNASAWLHPDDLAEHIKKVQALRDGTWVGPTSPVTQYRRKHKTRGWVWVEALGANLTDDPAVGAIVVTMRDMTERRRILEELERAKEAAEAASIAKSAFLANMSHELRTPLNGVIGMVELLARTALDDRQRRYTEVARASANSLLAVINDILDFSKIEAGKLEIRTVAFAPAEVVREVESVLRLSAEQKGVGLRCELGEDFTRQYMGDPGLLRQVLMNLVNNAIKFTAHGEVVVTAKIDGIDDGTRIPVLHMDVRDTGIGISREGIARLFQPFHQVDVSTTRSHGGTGLGLAISSQLVCRMGGTISVASEVGEGSMFSVRVPMREAEGQGATPPGTSASARPRVTQGISPTRTKLRALVVEDSEINAEVAGELMRSVGIEVDFAVNGALAVAAALAQRYDFILMDCQLPEMDGFEATRRIRAHECAGTISGPRLPIVALTASATTNDLDACLAAGMDSYVTKPVDPDHLFEAISRVTGREVGAPLDDSAQTTR